MSEPEVTFDQVFACKVCRPIFEYTRSLPQCEYERCNAILEILIKLYGIVHQKQQSEATKEASAVRDRKHEGCFDCPGAPTDSSCSECTVEIEATKEGGADDINV